MRLHKVIENKRVEKKDRVTRITDVHPCLPSHLVRLLLVGYFHTLHTEGVTDVKEVQSKMDELTTKLCEMPTGRANKLVVMLAAFNEAKDGDNI